MKAKRSFFHKKGFTLIEIIVVVAILGVFATIATIAVSSLKKSAEQKAANTAILSNWETVSDYFFQLNSGFGGAPSLTQLNFRTNNKVSGIGTKPATSISSGKIYVQYAENSTGGSKYTIVKITLNYKGKYYYSTNGSTVSSPSTSL